MSDAHIRADPHFDQLRRHGVHFYDSGATSPPLISPRPNALRDFDVATVAELLGLEDLEAVFEHEDEEDVYGAAMDTLEDNEEDDF